MKSNSLADTRTKIVVLLACMALVLVLKDAGNSSKTRLPSTLPSLPAALPSGKGDEGPSKIVAVTNPSGELAPDSKLAASNQEPSQPPPPYGSPTPTQARSKR